MNFHKTPALKMPNMNKIIAITYYKINKTS